MKIDNSFFNGSKTFDQWCDELFPYTIVMDIYLGLMNNE